MKVEVDLTGEDYGNLIDWGLSYLNDKEFPETRPEKRVYKTHMKIILAIQKQMSPPLD